MKYFSSLYKLSRPWEYYGFSILITTLGLLLAEVNNTNTAISVILANFLACMFIFVINDIEDRDYDALDVTKRARNPLSNGSLSLRFANLYCWSLCSLSILIYAALGFTPLIFGLLILLLGFLYSWKRVQLKSRPFFDLISHGLYFGPLLLLTGFNVGNVSVSLHSVLLCISVFILSVISDINNEIRDYAVDRLSGIKNTATIFNFVKYKWFFSVTTLVIISYIFFYVITTLPLLHTSLIVLYSLLHSSYVLYLVKVKRIHIYEYNKRNILYLGYACIILSYLYTLRL